MTDTNLSKEIYDCAISCGFDNCGIISIEAMDGFAPLLEKRVADVPQSKLFYDSVGNLQGTRERFPWAKSIIALTFDYGKYRYPKELQGKYAKAFFLYPNVRDGLGFDLPRFEKWLAEKNIRAEGGENLHHISVGPLRYMAAAAGLGMIRKNNFFYTENGSYNILVGYVIDKECELIQDVKLVPCGEKCDLCRRACKSGALNAEYTIDPLKCVSYWTTFGNSDVPQWLNADMFEEWVCGCDNCQDACPHNRRHDWSNGIPVPELEKIAPMLMPQNYGSLSDEFLTKQVISRTENHLQPEDVSALRKNAERAENYILSKGISET